MERCTLVSLDTDLLLPANSHVSDHLESGSFGSRKDFDDSNLGAHLDCSLIRNLLLEPPRFAASEF